MANKRDYFKRFSVTMPAALYDAFNEMIEARGIGNRSQVIADLVEREVIQARQEDPTRIMAGTLTLTYFEDSNSCASRLIQLRRANLEEVVSTQQVMLEGGKLMETWLVQGEVRVLQKMLAEALGYSPGMKGRLDFADALMPPVRHTKYVFNTKGDA
jgi:metal-responsive CopG/Arc/MetJ family transcriptional regulator